LSNTEFRITPQREVILEQLRRADSHLTANEIYEMVRARLPRISLGTVYRNLEILSRLGIIQKLEVGGAQRRFDAKTKNHYHLRCLSCGRIDDAPINIQSTLQGSLEGLTEYDRKKPRIQAQRRAKMSLERKNRRC
jgi:Fur family ferric uptake transcriptional regulator